ncbi:metallophosphoesterase [Chryseolinea sp. H1M3-3]|uniref:metallophosphoesterase n=1 Tax=Chryseolinea sp. H1M3-3 TaxID=3034144 RepID=UPI0023EDCB0D|nr:metallophosphoesterase [Chryseolinea sp. H1M3-3]
MRRLIRFLLLRPILWLVNTFSSSPNRERIYDALTTLMNRLQTDPGKKGFVIPLEINTGKFILFSDQHKGRKNGADDFVLAEANYITALNYYNQQGYHLICLGDCEELWKNTLHQVKKHNTPSFEVEKKFAKRNAFTKIFGNHDLDWEINPTAGNDLKELYDTDVAVMEGVMLQTMIEKRAFKIFCTHGHQGDIQSDGNLFSKFFVSKIWAPLQAYLRINPNTPAYNATLKTEHNTIMYEWSSQQKNLLLITGHTHQPVFESLTHLERQRREEAKKQNHANPSTPFNLEYFSKIKPTYFNTGCCCYDDGDITGIEISDGSIKLVKWEENEHTSSRIELEKISLLELVNQLALSNNA